MESCETKIHRPLRVSLPHSLFFAKKLIFEGYFIFPNQTGPIARSCLLKCIYIYIYIHISIFYIYVHIQTEIRMRIKLCLHTPFTTYMYIRTQLWAFDWRSTNIQHISPSLSVCRDNVDRHDLFTSIDFNIFRNLNLDQGSGFPQNKFRPLAKVLRFLHKSDIESLLSNATLTILFIADFNPRLSTWNKPRSRFQCWSLKTH